MPNHIPERQNAEPCFGLLQARQQLWKQAAAWQVVQLVAVVLIPIGGAIWALNYPEQRLAISLIAVGISLLDAVFVDRRYRAAIKMAAKASEHLDTQLFEIPWNNLSSGKPLQAEILRDASRSWRKKYSSDLLVDWYPSRIGDAPFEIGRIICQRTNVSYDSELRRTYSRILFICISVIGFGLFAYGIWQSASLNELLLGFLLPLAPFVIFAIRDAFRQLDAAAANDVIREEAEKVVESVINGTCTPDECEVKSRALQAAIYARRAANPLVFPGLYKIQRKRLEDRMHDGAEYWLERAGY